MEAIFLKVFPIILILLLGYFLKRVNILKKEDGDVFLKLVFYVSLPALLLVSITKINLEASLISLPLIGALIVLINTLIAYFVGKALNLPRATLGTFMVGATVMNTGFTLPFFIASFGEDGLARTSIFDFGNGLMTYTVAYYFACKYGEGDKNPKAMLGKFFSSPPLWALIIAILMNLLSLRIPELVGNFLSTVGALTAPLIMLSLGIYFNPTLVRLVPLGSALFIRLVIGLGLGFLFVYLFKLEGISKLVVLMNATAPIASNTLTFSSLENLDKEFAASLVSISILIGLVVTPLMIYFFY